MQQEYGLIKELGLWIREHRVVVISAGNAFAILVLTCVVAGAIQMSARKQAYADARAPRMEQTIEAPAPLPAPELPAVEQEPAPPSPRLRVRKRPSAQVRPVYSDERVEVRPRGYVPRQEPAGSFEEDPYSGEGETFVPEQVEGGESVE